MNNDVYQKSLELHKKFHGKIETISKIKLDNRDSLSLAYTPGVAEVCREISRDPKLANEYTLKRNTIAIVSDGSAILGLGNLGPLSAIPVMEGKAAIFKEFGGVDAFPICLNTQDTEEIIKTVKQIAPVFGGVNLEDISAPRCFEIEERLRAELDIPVMHDDQWGAATVTLAGLINSLKLVNKTKDAKVVVSGVGSAGVATARLLHAYGMNNIVYCDSQGIITKDRLNLTKEKIELINVSSANPLKGELADAIKGADIFIGLSKPGILTTDMVKCMAEKPIIFAMANPTPEIMPDEALKAGAFIVATGRSDFPNQANNSLVFPGVFKGILGSRFKQFEIGMFVEVAKKIASSVKEPTPDMILPSMFDKNIVTAVAGVIKDYK